MADHFESERAAVDIAAALNRLLDAEVPVDIVRDVYDKIPATFKRRLIISLVPRLWPDPEQCPDGC